MKVLLFGEKGMLGSAIAFKLGLYHDVAGLGHDDVDITVLSECKDIIEENKPNVVINAAAYTDVDAAESNAEQCFLVNAIGIRNIATVCRKKNIKIIHFSSDYVFDGKKMEPYVENDICSPLNVYGEAKFKGEQYLKEITNNYILIRTSWLYGKNGNNFVDSILEKGKNGEQIEVVDDQKSSPTYTVDLAAAVNFLLETEIIGTYHITNRGKCSWYEFARKIFQYAEIHDVELINVASQNLPGKAERPAYSVLSNNKFANATKKTMRFWQIALKDYINRVYYK